MTVRLFGALGLAGLAMMAGNVSPAGATILTFDIVDTANYAGSENFPEGFQIDQTYGDRVASSPTVSGTVTFSYGVGSEGYTPNVTVGYGPFSIFTGGPSLWRYNYGDLNRSLYQGSTAQPIGNNYNYLEITLVADPGYLVTLNGFDLGGWFEGNYTIDSVSVYDDYFNGFFPADNRVFHDPSALILGAGPAHSSYEFNTPISGRVVTILIDANNLGDTSENIGIDNIRFGQAIDPNPIPEPASLALLGLGTLGLAALRRRRRD